MRPFRQSIRIILPAVGDIPLERHAFEERTRRKKSPTWGGCLDQREELRLYLGEIGPTGSQAKQKPTGGGVRFVSFIPLPSAAHPRPTTPRRGGREMDNRRQPRGRRVDGARPPVHQEPSSHRAMRHARRHEADARGAGDGMARMAAVLPPSHTPSVRPSLRPSLPPTLPPPACVHRRATGRAGGWRRRVRLWCVCVLWPWLSCALVCSGMVIPVTTFGAGVLR